MKYEEFQINHEYIVDISRSWEINKNFNKYRIINKYDKSQLIEVRFRNGAEDFKSKKEYQDWKLIEDLGESVTEIAQIPSVFSPSNIKPEDYIIKEHTGNPNYLKYPGSTSMNNNEYSFAEKINNTRLSEAEAKMKEALKLFRQCEFCQHFVGHGIGCGLNAKEIREDSKGKCLSYEEDLLHDAKGKPSNIFPKKGKPEELKPKDYEHGTLEEIRDTDKPLPSCSKHPKCPMTVHEKSEFEAQIETLINQHCKDNESDTPDYILAKFIVACYDAFRVAVKERDGRNVV